MASMTRSIRMAEAISPSLAAHARRHPDVTELLPLLEACQVFLERNAAKAFFRPRTLGNVRSSVHGCVASTAAIATRPARTHPRHRPRKFSALPSWGAGTASVSLLATMLHMETRAAAASEVAQISSPKTLSESRPPASELAQNHCQRHHRCCRTKMPLRSKAPTKCHLSPALPKADKDILYKARGD